jgi:hypothetical protein
MKNLNDYQEALKLEQKYAKLETQLRKASHGAEQIILKRDVRKSLKGEISLKVLLRNRINSKLENLAKALPDEGYSMGSTVVVKCLSFIGRDDRTQEYARSSKYRASHGRVELIITPQEFRYLRVIGGLVTYIAPNQRAKVKKCYWYEGSGSKQYFTLNKVEGYIFNGYHATDKKAALKYGSAILEREKQAKASERAYRKALRSQFTFQDSLLAGNCEAGTRAFVLRLGLDSAKAYRGSFLLKKAAEKSISSVQFVERMVKYRANQ